CSPPPWRLRGVRASPAESVWRRCGTVYRWGPRVRAPESRSSCALLMDDLPHALLDLVARLPRLLLDLVDDLVRVAAGFVDVLVGQLLELLDELRLQVVEALLDLLLEHVVESHLVPPLVGAPCVSGFAGAQTAPPSRRYAQATAGRTSFSPRPHRSVAPGRRTCTHARLHGSGREPAIGSPAVQGAVRVPSRADRQRRRGLPSHGRARGERADDPGCARRDRRSRDGASEGPGSR